MTAPATAGLIERLRELNVDLRTLNEVADALAASEADARVIDIARAAICSIGSFDRGLQNHYQRQLDAALTKEPQA